jgi:hypothetical protein
MMRIVVVALVAMLGQVREDLRFVQSAACDATI